MARRKKAFLSKQWEFFDLKLKWEVGVSWQMAWGGQEELVSASLLIRLFPPRKLSLGKAEPDTSEHEWKNFDVNDTH